MQCSAVGTLTWRTSFSEKYEFFCKKMNTTTHICINTPRNNMNHVSDCSEPSSTTNNEHVIIK